MAAGGDLHVPALVRVDEAADAIEALAARSGGRIGLDGVLAGLDRQGRHARARIPGTVQRLTWDAEDRRTRRWWPQGISTSADAAPEGTVLGRRLLVVSWYERARAGVDHQPGSRVSFLDLDTLRYRHVALVRAVRARSGAVRAEPVRVHAGGLVWHGDWLHVAATRRGFLSFRVDDVLALGGELVLPLHTAYRPVSAQDRAVLRHSFLSLDRGATASQSAGLLAGEYARSGERARLVRYPLDGDTSLPVTEGPEHRLLPTWVADTGLTRMQGAVRVHGRFVVSTSHGPWLPGSLVVGGPGTWQHRWWALPMGPEALAWSPADDVLWTLSEHPLRRWVVAMPAGRHLRGTGYDSRG